MMEASLGWAIAGTGAIARRFAGEMRLSRRGRVAAVASRDPERARRLAGAVGPDVGYGDLDAVLRRPEVGAVYVAGRNKDHAATALRCLAAGKPVLIEKPLATSAAEAIRIADAAREARCLAMEAMWMRFTPGIRRLKALVDAGEIGEVLSVEASLAFRNPDPQAAVLLDLGVYPVSLALHLLGLPDGIAAAGSAAGDRLGLVLGYRRAVATLSCGFSAEGQNTLSVTGESGIVATDSPFFCPSFLSLRRTRREGGASVNAPEDLPARSRLPWIGSAKAMLRPLRTKRIPTVFKGSGLHYQADHFAECIAAGLADSPVMPLAESTDAIRIVTAAQAMLQGSGNGSKLDLGR